ncbi:MAG: DUF4822 domain-containing protein, partial [Culicoidibacterales bacterium]
WSGTVVKDMSGNDLSAYNSGFLGLARYDSTSNRYEFFNKDTGVTRGDLGYYDVIRNNKVRAHVSLGLGYAANLELTEINENRFTYTRTGKDASGADVPIIVEHEPYNGTYPLAFTFGEGLPDAPKVNPLVSGSKVLSGTSGANLTITATITTTGQTATLAVAPPIVVTTKADPTGFWSITLSDPLTSGQSLTFMAQDASGLRSALTTITIPATNTETTNNNETTSAPATEGTLPSTGQRTTEFLVFGAALALISATILLSRKRRLQRANMR